MSQDIASIFNEAKTLRETGNVPQAVEKLGSLFKTGKGLTKEIIHDIIEECVELRNEGHIDDSSTILKTLLELDGTNTEALNWLTLNLVRENKVEDAITHWKNAQKLEPENTNIKIGLANAYSLNLEYARSIQIFTETLPDLNDKQKNFAKASLDISEEQLNLFTKVLEEHGKQGLDSIIQQIESERQNRKPLGEAIKDLSNKTNAENNLG